MESERRIVQVFAVDFTSVSSPGRVFSASERTSPASSRGATSGASNTTRCDEERSGAARDLDGRVAHGFALIEKVIRQGLPMKTNGERGRQEHQRDSGATTPLAAYANHTPATWKTRSGSCSIVVAALVAALAALVGTAPAPCS